MRRKLGETAQEPRYLHTVRGVGIRLSAPPAPLAVADRLARSLVAPIMELAEVSHRLAGAQLSARATPAGPPELREVAHALNHLAGRIQELLRDEREHVADLSHRLRTPLTALRLEAEALTDPPEAARVTAAVDGLENAVTALIQQARRNEIAGGGPGPDGAAQAGGKAEVASCDAARVVRERVAFWSVLAEDTGRPLSVDVTDLPAPVRMDADTLTAAVDALLGNVFAHTPDGTAFAVTLRRRPDGGVDLTVADHGPGLPDGAARRGESRADSTGLGLDIARRAAKTSGGRLKTADGPAGGAAITLVLEPPTPASSNAGAGPPGRGRALRP
ncbi:sensor histidine kinase [Parafrankia soli]|uniref:sensor histidine kinase n=1 Tax=Parafrankia soli TaxID=2599596 RepID=UPI003B846F36